MKICIIVDDYLPDSIKIAAKMMHELARALQAAGHDVIVITPSHSTVKWQCTELDGVPVYRFRSPPIKNVSKLRRALGELLLSYRAYHSLKSVLRERTCDRIVYYSPSIFWGPLVKKLKRLWHCDSYLILRDIFPQWAVDQGMIGSYSPITLFFRLFERMNYRAADTIALQSPGNLRWFANYYRGPARQTVLYNWAEDRPLQLTEQPYRSRLGLEQRIIYFYGGNLGHAQDMSQILQLARSLEQDPQAAFILIGDGDARAEIATYIAREKPANLWLLDPLPGAEFTRLLAECDIGLFCLHHDHSVHNFPGKVLAYLVQGMPVLGAVNPGNDLQDVINSAGAGLVSVAGAADTFTAHARSLLDSDRRKKMGCAARNLLKERFSVAAAAHKVLR